jgi:hypothetical protein
VGGERRLGCPSSTTSLKKYVNFCGSIPASSDTVESDYLRAADEAVLNEDH